MREGNAPAATARAGLRGPLDAEYERNGVAHLLLYYVPLENWRRMDVTSDHVATAWAEGVRQLVEENFPDAERGEVAAWTSRRNANGPPATWRFTTADAPIKLQGLYLHLSD